jgi:hypothetical protein
MALSARQAAWLASGNARRKHGAASRIKGEAPEYGIWLAMKRRCYNPHNRKYPRYGGRGIIVCDRWLGEDGFSNFLADMGRRPSPELTLDRKNNDGNYEPGNCRWATQEVQQNNRSDNINKGVQVSG